jgi:hypothetical protein
MIEKFSMGEFHSLNPAANIVCLFGERLIEVTTLSRGAMRKQQGCAFREHQQQSPLYVTDWLKRREILSLLQEAAKQ